MTKQIVIVSGERGYSDYVVLFDNEDDCMPFLKTKLKALNIYDVDYREAVDSLSNIHDTVDFIDDNNIHEVAVYIVTKVNPSTRY